MIKKPGWNIKVKCEPGDLLDPNQDVHKRIKEGREKVGHAIFMALACRMLAIV